VLLPRLNDPDTGVASCVLFALGQLSAIGGEELLPYLPRLLPLIVASLKGCVADF
jgi:FKBP12-rapamycin complex-associated protein